MRDQDVLTGRFRLNDRFGDNGVIALLIGRRNSEGDVEMDTWLMRSRVLGRVVEQLPLTSL
jgi:predicted enzyme involved in methoxymalonyl-ACP biosynthesis